MLTLLALPMQTAAHTQIGHINQRHSGPQEGRGTWEPGHQTEPNPIPQEIINWIRVYKNPEIVRVAPDGELSSNAPANLLFTLSGEPLPVYDFSAYELAVKYGFLSPSYFEGLGQDVYWVKFDSDGDLFEDPAKEGRSGLVTATENTSVGIGDIVAIAVNITSWGGTCTANMAIGPKVLKPYYWSHSSAGRIEQPYEEGKWRLNANLPMWEGTYNPSIWVTALGGPRPRYVVTPVPAAARHTLVYQFRVEPQHVDLNAEGPWLKYEFVLSSETTELTHATVDREGANTYRQFTAFDWLWNENQDVPPPSTTVKPFNTYLPSDRFQTNWGATVSSGLPGWSEMRKPSVAERIPFTNFRVHYYYEQHNASHRHVPLFDPAVKGAIFYPKIEAPDSRASTTMDVPGGTQTGAFTVTLHFRDGEVFEGHDFSDAGVEAFKATLTTAVADSGWTVTGLSVASVPAIASSGKEATAHSAFTAYQLTLSPPLGAKGELELLIPENVVMDAGENGNFASASVTVPVDAPLRLAEGKAVAVAAPAEGAYLAGHSLEVLVPFAEAGLTYEGDTPPYLTIYLGEGTANPRHATWQRGEESAGSTVVPFRYTIAATDPIVSSVRVDADAGVLLPTGTKLMSRSGRSSLVGADEPAMASGKKAPVPDATENAGFATSTGAAVTSPEVAVQVLPAVYLPPTEESEPKAGMSSIPRSPIVFNELGNGSGDTNDWLELRNVTGDAVSLKDWELSVVADGKKEDTSLVAFTTDVSVPAEGLLLITNSDPTADGNLLAGGDDITTAKAEVKGSSHLYLVNAGLSLPDNGQFLLILRNAKEKLGLNEAFVDVAGGGGSGTDAFVREQEGDYDTYVWPLQVLEAPGSATEDALSSGKVWLRAKADIVGYHRDAWAEAAFTGVGYDRKVTKSAETAGTPGYPNGAVKTEAATPRGAITISEVMLDSAGGTLPQWVELYNASKTDALNLNRWELEIQNVDSEDLVGRPVVRLTLQEKVIQPNQTLLIVTGNARASSADVYPADRVYNLLELHDKNLRIKKPSDTFLSATGFYLRLTDRNEHLVDEVGNTDGDRRTDDTPAWALPVPLSEVEGMRSSLVRRYDKGVARDGKEKSSWALAANFAKFKAAELHYGHADDIGTPGYRQGGALPVELSSFTVTRVESGSVIVTWTTESEVDNAGFNLRRSLTRDSGFTLLNPALIAGAGTTGERQTYTFIDTSAKPGVEHYYQIEEVSFGGQAETLVTRRLRGPVSPAHRALKTLGEVKQAK